VKPWRPRLATALAGPAYFLPADPSDDVGRAAVVLVAARAWIPPEVAGKQMSAILERARARAQVRP
jgi:hypothetical protein